MVSYKSINHLSSDLSEREQQLATLKLPLNIPHVWLQTCNRIEMYYGSGNIPEATALHLFRVVSGLESGLLGESAIQGQVKTAYEQARERYDLSPALHRLFQNALRVGKRVRNQSGIGRGAVSHGQATVELIKQSGINLKNALITLIGVNKLTEDTIRFLQSQGAATIFVANRSYEKARPYAEKYDCQILGFDRLEAILEVTDILISATSAPHMVVTSQRFPKNKSMQVYDLAFPRDIDPAIGKLPGVSLYNLENIENLISNNLKSRRNEMDIASGIIENEVKQLICRPFMRSLVLEGNSQSRV
jgi:glutamyl-tRNA reductase